MIKLYAATGTGSVAPQALLTYLEVPFEIDWIDYDQQGHKAAEFLAINPRGQLPALVLEDGTVVTESSAIMLHIADVHGMGTVIPPAASVERARVYRWVAFAATNLYEGLLRILYPDAYTSSDPEAVKTSADEYVHNALSILNTEIAERNAIIGDSVGITDIYVSMLMTWYPEPEQLPNRYPGLSRMFNSVMALEGVQYPE